MSEAMLYLRKKYGKCKQRVLISRAIRGEIPGGEEILDAMSRLHAIVKLSVDPDPRVVRIFELVVAARDKMADAVLDAASVAAAAEGADGDAQDYEPVQEPEQPALPMSTREGPAWEPLLGTMTDMALAAQVGVSHTAIRKRRVAKGIPSFAGDRARIDWARWDTHVLAQGMTPDGLARLIGCDPSTVRERRRALKEPQNLSKTSQVVGRLNNIENLAGCKDTTPNGRNPGIGGDYDDE